MSQIKQQLQALKSVKDRPKGMSVREFKAQQSGGTMDYKSGKISIPKPVQKPAQTYTSRLQGVQNDVNAVKNPNTVFKNGQGYSVAPQKQDAFMGKQSGVDVNKAITDGGLTMGKTQNQSLMEKVASGVNKISSFLGDTVGKNLLDLPDALKWGAKNTQAVSDEIPKTVSNIGKSLTFGLGNLIGDATEATQYQLGGNKQLDEINKTNQDTQNKISQVMKSTTVNPKTKNMLLQLNDKLSNPSAATDIYDFAKKTNGQIGGESIGALADLLTLGTASEGLKVALSKGGVKPLLSFLASKEGAGYLAKQSLAGGTQFAVGGVGSDISQGASKDTILQDIPKNYLMGGLTQPAFDVAGGIIGSKLEKSRLRQEANIPAGLSIKDTGEGKPTTKTKIETPQIPKESGIVKVEPTQQNDFGTFYDNMEKQGFKDDMNKLKAIFPKFKDGAEFSKLNQIASRYGKIGAENLPTRERKLVGELVDKGIDSYNFKKLGELGGQDFKDEFGSDFFNKFKSGIEENISKELPKKAEVKSFDPEEVNRQISYTKQGQAKAVAKKKGLLEQAKLDNEKSKASFKVLDEKIQQTRREELLSKKDELLNEAIKNAEKSPYENKGGATVNKSADKNPIKVNIPEVAKGDYAKARSNAQVAKSTITNAGQQVEYTVSRLSKKDQKLFDYAVEDNSLIKTADNPKMLQEAVRRQKILTDTVHAIGKSLGGDTGYLDNYIHRSWDLSKPEDAAKFKEIMKKKFGNLYNQKRTFSSIKEGEAYGFKLKTSGLEGVKEYHQTASYVMHNEALSKGLQEADRGSEIQKYQPYAGADYYVSKEGYHATQTYRREPFDIGTKARKAVDVYDKANRGMKRFLLGWSQFHTNNVGFLQAATSAILRGHPIQAVKGMINMEVSLFSKSYSDRIMQDALESGLVDFGARVGSPLRYGSDFETSGLLQSTETAVFGRQIPAMHVQMLQGLKDDLLKRGVSIESKEARESGDAINRVMGFINTEAKNFNPHLQTGFGRVALAPQFTRSKWSLLRDSFIKGGYLKGGSAGNIARSAVAGKYMAEVGIAVGLGYIVKEKSDTIKDVMIRALVHPAIPTPWKDSNGKNVELNLPANYISELAKLGVKLERGDDGRLGLSFRPQDLKQNLVDYGLNRLAVVPNIVNKIVNNTTFANKHLYDPQAPLPKKTIQAITQLVGDLLPIGAQGLLNTPQVMGVLPQASQDILKANSPGDHPFLKSLGSSFGVSPGTDVTQGKGQSTDKYFTALDDTAKTLDDNNQKTFYGVLHPTTKNSVDGTPMVDKNLYTTPSKYAVLLQSLTGDKKLFDAEKSLQLSQKSHDPLWDLPNDQIQAFFQASTIKGNDPGVTNKTATALYARLPQDFFQNRSDYYDGLVKSGQMPVTQQLDNQGNPLPTVDKASPELQAKMDAYSKMTNPKQKKAYLMKNKDITDYWNKTASLSDAKRSSMGLPTKQDQNLDDAVKAMRSGNKSNIKYILQSLPKDQRAPFMQQVRDRLRNPSAPTQTSQTTNNKAVSQAPSSNQGGLLGMAKSFLGETAQASTDFSEQPNQGMLQQAKAQYESVKPKNINNVATFNKYSQTISDSATKRNVPPKILAALLNQESGFDPAVIAGTRKSSAGAIGIAQFMPSMARSRNVDPLDPNSAIDGAAQYLKDLYDEFGSWELALAGYNAGEGAVKKYGGIPPFPETQNYVKSIMDNVN